MKTIHFILLSICYCTSLFSQVNISGTVRDAETKEAIPFVNIGIKNSTIGTVSDINGSFQLMLDSEEEKVTFSSIGYEVIQLSGAQVLEQSIVQLIPKDYQIPAVQLSAQRIAGEDQIFGVKNKTRGLSIGYGSRNLGTEIGALIAIDGPTYIKNANFVLNHAQGDSLLFRVNIYDYREGKIGEKVWKENILIACKQRRGTITIDLTSLNLILEGDVLLALEWIKDDEGKGNTGITFDTKKSKKGKGVFVKNWSIGSFEKMGFISPKLKPCFYFVGKKINGK